MGVFVRFCGLGASFENVTLWCRTISGGQNSRNTGKGEIQMSLNSLVRIRITVLHEFLAAQSIGRPMSRFTPRRPVLCLR